MARVRDAGKIEGVEIAMDEGSAIVGEGELDVSNKTKELVNVEAAH